MYQIITDIGMNAVDNTSLLSACRKAVKICGNTLVRHTFVVDDETGEVIAEYHRVGNPRRGGMPYVVIRKA